MRALGLPALLATASIAAWPAAAQPDPLALAEAAVREARIAANAAERAARNAEAALQALKAARDAMTGAAAGATVGPEAQPTLLTENMTVDAPDTEAIRKVDAAAMTRALSNSVANGPNDSFLKTGEAPDLQFTVSEKEKVASVSVSFNQSHTTDDRYLLTDQFTLSGSSKLDESGEASLGGLKGFANGTDVSLTYTNFRTPVVWSIASHHPEHCLGVAGLCVPYLPQGFTPATCEPYVDRRVYPSDQFPAGQWDYMHDYEGHFARAQAAYEANALNTVKALFRKGDPAARGKPSRLASARRNGGIFGPLGAAPDLPVDHDILSDDDLHQYAASLARNGFFGPNSWYLNAAANLAYAKRARQAARLDMPVLFFHAAHDYVCETIDSPLAQPMREACANLTEVTVASGHWMAQEKPVAVNAGLARWLAREFPTLWSV